MFGLAGVLYSLIGTTLAGSAIVVSLVMGYDTLVPVVISAGFGLVAAIPASLIIAKQISGGVSDDKKAR